jgi:hypothetical protein
MSTIGYINPTLYSQNFSGNFNDVTSGYNKCCSYTGSNPSSASCCPSGFYASSGWDPVTGLGSIYYTTLSEMFSVPSSYNPSVPDLSPRNFFGIPATIMAIIILILLVFAILYPLGAYLRRKYLPKTVPTTQPEEYRDLKLIQKYCIYIGNKLGDLLYGSQQQDPTDAYKTNIIATEYSEALLGSNLFQNDINSDIQQHLYVPSSESIKDQNTPTYEPPINRPTRSATNIFGVRSEYVREEKI